MLIRHSLFIKMQKRQMFSASFVKKAQNVHLNFLCQLSFFYR